MDFLNNIILKKHLLTKNELKACDGILDNILLVQQLSFTELSDTIGITKASILRFCKKVGYSGYNEFRYECIKYVNSINNVNNDEKQEVKTNIKKVATMYSDVINLMEEVVSEEEIINLVELIRTSRRVKAVGVVNSSLACYQLRYAFLMFGVEIDVVKSDEELKTLDISMKKDDLIIIFSASAKQKSVQRALELKDTINVKVALITMNLNSEYKNKVDIFIGLPSISNLKNESILNSVPIFSIFIEMLNVYYNS